jgi:hypothetical protein
MKSREYQWIRRNKLRKFVKIRMNSIYGKNPTTFKTNLIDSFVDQMEQDFYH